MPSFVEHARTEQEPHRFDVWDCRGTDAETLEDELAALVRELYVEPDRLKDILSRAAADLEPTVDTAMVDKAVELSIEATVPEAGVHPRPQLDMARNEVAELLAYRALPDIYGVVVPAKRIRHKDVPQLPVRGLDLLGVIAEPELALVLCEAKASTQAATPPAVVGDGDSSLRAQLGAFLGDSEKIMRELTWVVRHAPTEAEQDLAAKAMLALAAEALPVVVVPLLLRPVQRHGDSDFGTFADDPDQFTPATVWFCLLRVETSLDTLADRIYGQAST